MEIDNLIQDLVLSPTPINYLKVAEEYYKLKQYGSAFSYYLRCLDVCDVNDFQYKYHCLCTCSWILYLLKNRTRSALQFARFAKSECPDRPEAYYLISIILTDDLNNREAWECGDWIQVYENSKVGLLFDKVKKVKPNRYYHGFESLYSFYLISLLRNNLIPELEDALTWEFTKPLNPEIFWTIDYIYTYRKMRNPNVLLTKDNCIPEVKKYLETGPNASRCSEDLFALSCGCESYLEITAKDPVGYSNIELFHKNGFSGVTISNDPGLLNLSEGKFILSDPLNLDYSNMESKDYIDINLSNPQESCKCLFKIPIRKINPKCITITHCGDPEVQSKVDRYLTSNGFICICRNIQSQNNFSLSDWYTEKSIYESNKEFFDKINNRSTLGFNIFRI